MGRAQPQRDARYLIRGSAAPFVPSSRHLAPVPARARGSDLPVVLSAAPHPLAPWCRSRFLLSSHSWDVQRDLLALLQPEQCPTHC